ncbi:MAG: cytochrome c biogenesis protein CcsA [Desulfobacterales bacterium]|nr:cytochrome c biogenesis protein CcsA [Desulfobacterales bacterium]
MIIIVSVLFYFLSTAAYIAYFFIQKNYLYKIGFYLLLTGLFFHSTDFIFKFTQINVFPINSLQDTLLLAAIAIPISFMLFQYKLNLKILGGYAALSTLFITIIAIFLPTQRSAEIQNLFKNSWLASHVIIIFMGNAFLSLACGAGLLYLIQEYTIKTKHNRFFFKRLPSLELLDSAGYTSIIMGFTLLSLGMIIGFTYGKIVWGKFWTWSPKEVCTSVTWILYSALIHERLTVGWRGRRSAIMAIIGFVLTIFTFLGIIYIRYA